MDVLSPPPSRFSPETRLGIIIRVAFFIATVLIGMAVFPRAILSGFGPIIASTCGLLATGLVANWLTLRVFDRQPLRDAGLPGGRASLHNFLIGIVFSVVTAGLMLGLPLLAGGGHLVPHAHAHAPVGSVAFFFLLLLCGAAGEETIFRGYAFQFLVDKIGPFATVLPVAVIFGFAHSSNPHASVLGIVNTVIWGFVLGYAFLRSHDLWFPIGLHYGWNFALPLFGTTLSGLTIDVTRYSYRWDLSPLWSGGAYGPEGGVLTTIFAIALGFALSRAPVAPQRAAVAKSLNDVFSDL
ncbi:MAG TPA: type II CAAX endopeptidase family protein [Bryobacteraceae bacterium]